MYRLYRRASALLWMSFLTVLAAAPARAAGQEAAEAKSLPVALVEALNKIGGGPREGYRANHAKGVMVAGQFTPSPNARALSKAPQFLGPVPITVRFSNDSGNLTFSDAAPNARPHGISIRMHLPNGATSDLIAISTQAFPVATPEEFLALLQAVIASGAGVAKPTPLDRFLATHPSTVRYFTSTHPATVSFGTLGYYGLNAFKFTNAAGDIHYVRYQIVPTAGQQFLSEAAAAKAAPNYLMDELPARVSKGPVTYTLYAQLANDGDDINDSSVAWPSSNARVELGTISLDKNVADQVEAQRAILFNPVALPDGIEPSADPILAMRFPAYAVSFNQRAAPVSAEKLSTEELAKAKNCLACHSITAKIVGPAYKDVAAKYAGLAGAEDKLVQKVLKGGAGVWGPIPMPPNSQVTEAEARQLVQWVLQRK
jgi:catalase